MVVLSNCTSDFGPASLRYRAGIEERAELQHGVPDMVRISRYGGSKAGKLNALTVLDGVEVNYHNVSSISHLSHRL